MGGRVEELWRYPVKSMRGERLDAAEVTESGLVGDRGYAVVDGASGKVGSAKHPRLWGALLSCTARYAREPRAGEPLPPVEIALPDGSTVASDDPAVDDRLSALFDRPVRLTTTAPDSNEYLAVWPEDEGVMPDDVRQQARVDGDDGGDGTLTKFSLALASPPGTFFDVAALHVVSRRTLDELGRLAPESSFAVGRYRPNVVLDTEAAPFAENGWTGATLQLGPALTAPVLLPTMRCIMTTLAQGDLPRDAGTLRAVSRHNRVDLPGLGTWSCVGAYAAVATSGTVSVGDDVTLVPAAT